MRIVTTFAFAIALCIPAYAQLNPVPPASLPNDGVFMRPLAGHPDQPGWTSSDLYEYRVGGGLTRPAAGAVDSLGRTWTTAAPTRNGLQSQGGTIRFIYLGGDLQFLNSFGYAYDSAPTGGNSFALSHVDGSTDASTCEFGHFADISLAPGQPLNFDLWLNPADRAYTLFDGTKSVTDGVHTGSVLWTATPLLVSTYLPSPDQYVGVETWVGSVIESDGNGGKAEARFAVQFFERSGWPIAAPAPVPEPSTYALCGAIACGVIVWMRRRRGA